MTESRDLLKHFLGAIAYRTQKALRGAPPHFADFRASPTSRTPYELLWHMTGLIGYARTMFHGGVFEPARLASIEEEVARFHSNLEALREDLVDPSLTASITDAQLLHGPLADTMTHVGQLAFLRRMCGSPVASENFIFASISDRNLSANQAEPIAPDVDWKPEEMPPPPGPRRRGMSAT
jgi:hypothetical protein